MVAADAAVLEAMHAPAKAADVPVLDPKDLGDYDAIIFGVVSSPAVVEA